MVQIEGNLSLQLEFQPNVYFRLSIQVKKWVFWVYIATTDRMVKVATVYRYLGLPMYKLCTFLV